MRNNKKAVIACELSQTLFGISTNTSKLNYHRMMIWHTLHVMPMADFNSETHLLLHKTDDLQIPYVVQTCSMKNENCIYV